MADHDIMVVIGAKDETRETGLDSAAANIRMWKSVAEDAHKEVGRSSGDMGEQMKEAANGAAERFLGMREVIHMVKETFKEVGKDISAYNGQIGGGMTIASGAASTFTGWLIKSAAELKIVAALVANIPGLAGIIGKLAGNVLPSILPDKGLHDNAVSNLEAEQDLENKRERALNQYKAHNKGGIDDRGQPDTASQDRYDATHVTSNRAMRARETIEKAKQAIRDAEKKAMSEQGQAPSEMIEQTKREEVMRQKATIAFETQIVDLYSERVGRNQEISENQSKLLAESEKQKINLNKESSAAGFLEYKNQHERTALDRGELDRQAGKLGSMKDSGASPEELTAQSRVVSALSQMIQLKDRAGGLEIASAARLKVDTDELTRQESILEDLKNNHADIVQIATQENIVTAQKNKIQKDNNDLVKEAADATARQAEHEAEITKRKEGYDLDDRQAAAELEKRSAEDRLNSLNSVKNVGNKFHIVHVRQEQQQMATAVSHLAKISADIAEIKSQKRELTLQ